MVFTWDGSKFNVYIDGELQRTFTKSSGLSHTYEGMVISMRGSIDFLFRGGIDEVRIYNRALFLEEVQALAGAIEITATGSNGTIIIEKLTD